MVRALTLTLGLACLLCIPAAAEVYQYAVPATSADGKDIMAYLWVPPEADRLRGVLVGGMTLMEPEFSRDPIIRQACAGEKLAIVFFSPSLDALFNYGDSLKPAEIPKRATFPLKITVIAYQYGSAVEPFVQSAEPVKQVVEVRK